MHIPKSQIVIGIHAVRELLLHAPQRLLHLFLEGEKGERKKELIQLCKKREIPFTFTSFDQLTEIAGTDTHQSVLAHVKGRNFLNVKRFLEKAPEKSLVLMLDQIFDPQNFGAVLRSAECFGVDAVVWSKNRGCDLTPVATKAACGASELLSLVRISNLAEAVSQFQQEGDFEVVAATCDSSTKSLFSFQPSSRTLLVVGSEGEGIQPLIRKRADRHLFIPMKGKIASLNVAQATSVFLAYLSRP